MFTIKPSLASHLIPVHPRVDHTIGHHSSNVHSAVISSIQVFCRAKELVHDRPDSRVVNSCVHCSIIESSCSIIELPATFHDSRQHSVRLIFQCGVLVFIEPNMAGSLGLEDPEPGDTAPHLCWLPTVLDHLGSSLLALVDKPVCMNNSKPVQCASPWCLNYLNLCPGNGRVFLKIKVSQDLSKNLWLPNPVLQCQYIQDFSGYLWQRFLHLMFLYTHLHCHSLILPSQLFQPPGDACLYHSGTGALFHSSHTL